MDKLKEQLHQIVYTWLAFPRAVRFVRLNRLWQGLKDYRWVYKFLLFVAALAGFFLITEFFDYRGRHADATIGTMLFSSEGFLARFGSETLASITDGSLKWVILILLEVVIYHFMRQTLRLIHDRDMPDAHTFKPFFEAQKRMVAVSFMAYGLEVLYVEVLSGIFFGIFGFLAFLRPLTVLLVQSILMGFAIVDNYNEQFKLTIKQSFRYTRLAYLGVCIGLGLPLFFILKVPFFGAVIGPIIAAVTAGIVMKEISDLATVGYVMSEKEAAKFAKQQAKQARKLARMEKRDKRG